MTMTVFDEIEIMAGEVDAIREELEEIRISTSRDDSNRLQVPVLALEAITAKLERLANSQQEQPAPLVKDCAKLCEAVKSEAERSAAKGDRSTLEFVYYYLIR